MKRAVLLDVSAIMYRAFYGNMNFRTKSEPTGAVYGFANTLLSIINEFKPDYIGAAFDVSRSTLKRSEIYKEYKAQRDAAPEDLIKQIPRIEELLDNFGIKRFKIDGLEADDVLGSLGDTLSKESIETFVVTGDKDLAQILDENINIALLGKGDGGGFKILSTPEDVKEQLGVTPKMIPDLFGLIGDSSDGIPGVRKIGVKKAVPMLDKYGNLEGVYENIDKLTELPGIGKSLVQNMMEDKELAFLSRKLATIEVVDLGIKGEELTYSLNEEKLYEMFKKLEFRSLIKKMNLKEKVVEVSVTPNVSINNQNSQMGLFDMLGNSEPVEVNMGNSDSLDELGENIFLYYGEIGVALVDSKKNLYYSLKDEKRREKFKEFLNSSRKFISYGFKPMLNDGYKVKNMEFDSLIAYHLLTSQTREDVENMIYHVNGDELEKYSEVFGKKTLNEIDENTYGEFLIKRALGIKESYEELSSKIKDENLEEVFRIIEMPLIKVLSSMEVAGIKIDPEYFYKFSEELEEKLNGLTKKIYEIAGEEFNINSPKQLSEILFLKLNLDPIKKTKTGFSTGVEVLEELGNRGAEIAQYILEYRKLSKLKSTYVDPLPKMTDTNNRLHTTFNQTGTATGRLSSSNPNLQNIPVRTDEGIRIRQGFVADEGNVLLGIDYSQIELRVLGEISEDTSLIDAYNRGEDLHSLTARKIFDLGENDEVGRDQRAAAKIVNFSIIYGKTAFGLSQELKITPSEATDYIERYFNQYPKVKELENSIIEFAKENGYVETYFKRKRIIDGINSKNMNIRKQGERMAVNTVIQGTAAEVIKKVMITLYDYLIGKNDIKMLLQVHDELIFEVAKDKVQEYKDEIVNIMENTVKFKHVKLEVNSAIGENWAETK
ncbi:DNA polymerase I [Cetobacterium ceti]